VGREEGGGQGRRARAADALTHTPLEPRLHSALRKLGWVALALSKAATLVYTAEAIIRPHQPKYAGKAMRIRSLGYLGGLGLVPAVWLAGDRSQRYPVAADLAVTGPLLVDAAGNSLGIYDAKRIDDAVHFLNAAVLASLFGAVISTKVRSRRTAVAATLVFGIVGELAFDGMEYAAERIGFTGLGLSPEDTIADVAAAGLGTAIAAGVTWARWQPRAGAPLLGHPAAGARRLLTAD
jgi:hypothetical protein